MVEAGAHKLFPLSLIAVEHVDIDLARDAADTSVRTKLPVDELDIRLVLAIAGYPDVVTLFDVGRIPHVLIDEHLADVENGAHTGAPLHYLEECAYAPHQLLIAANLLDLCVAGLYVEDGREVTLAE